MGSDWAFAAPGVNDGRQPNLDIHSAPASPCPSRRPGAGADLLCAVKERQHHAAADIEARHFFGVNQGIVAELALEA